jgi:hypothetical protein
MIARAVLLLALLSLCACASGQSTVLVVHTLPATGNGRTISILAADPTQSGTQAFQNYTGKLSGYLASGGYRVVPFSIENPPAYVAYFGYGINGGTLVRRTYARPQIDVTGLSGPSAMTPMEMSGNMGSMGNMQTTAPMPIYGVTRYDTSTTTTRLYRRVVALDIFDMAKFRPDVADTFQAARVYSGRLVSDGSCGSIAGIMDPLLAGLAKDFPGTSGKTRTAAVPNDQSNC